MGRARHVVLGGSGFIGRHVTRALLSRGETVVVAGRSPPPIDAPPLERNVSFVPFDLQGGDLRPVLRDGDVVHHYAWSTIPKTANDDPLADLEANLRATVRLLDAMRTLRGIRLLFASSGGTVYGPARRLPIVEGHPLAPVTAYGASKVAAEIYLGFYRAQHGLDCRIARIANPYGMGQRPERQQGAVSVFLHRALTGRAIEVWGDGGVVRDYVHISDVTRALLALADAETDTLGPAPVFNIGSGQGTSLNQLLAMLETGLRRRPRVRFDAARRFDVPVNVLDIGCAAAALGWRPTVGLAAGLDGMIADHREGREYSSALESVASVALGSHAA